MLCNHTSFKLASRLMLVLNISSAVFSLGLSVYINLLFLICRHKGKQHHLVTLVHLRPWKYIGGLYDSLAFQNENSQTSSRLTGSLKAKSRTSLVGTIFHFGMRYSILLNTVMKIGCGCIFSAIYQNIRKQIRCKICC